MIIYKLWCPNYPQGKDLINALYALFLTNEFTETISIYSPIGEFLGRYGQTIHNNSESKLYTIKKVGN